jgi:hypothetical protein
MEPHILFALLLIGPVEPTPVHGRKVTWSAEFSSQQSCEAAGSALGRKFNTTPTMQQRFVAVVDYVCIKK